MGKDRNGRQCQFPARGTAGCVANASSLTLRCVAGCTADADQSAPGPALPSSTPPSLKGHDR